MRLSKIFAALMVVLLELSAADTHVLLRLDHAVNARTVKVGDHVFMKTATPIIADGRMVADIGSQAQGVVTRVTGARLFHRRAELEMKLVSITLANNSVLRVNGSVRPAELSPDYKWRHTNGVVAAAPLLGPLMGAAIGGGTGVRAGMAAGVAVVAVNAFMGRGRDIELKPGSALDAVFETTVDVEP